MDWLLQNKIFGKSCLWDLTHVLECIVSDISGFIKGFEPFSIKLLSPHTHTADPTMVDHFPAATIHEHTFFYPKPPSGFFPGLWNGSNGSSFISCYTNSKLYRLSVLPMLDSPLLLTHIKLSSLGFFSVLPTPDIWLPSRLGL